MLVKQVMNSNSRAFSENKTLAQAAAEMQEHGFGFLPITQENQLIGVVTDRDIIIRGIAKGLNPNEITVKDIMTDHIYFCHEEDDIKKAAQIMSEKQVNRLAVYNKNNSFCGVLSLGDIARHVKDINLCGEITQAIHQK